MATREAITRRAPGASGGFTLIEVSVALAGAAVIAVMMTSFFVGATRVEEMHRADDDALTQLRDARQRMSRDIREARRFTWIDAASFTVWIDEGWDEVVGADETITWSIDEGGNLRRAVGEDSRIEAQGLSVAESWFEYDAVVASSVTSMQMHLVAVVEDRAGTGRRTLDTEISMRNVP
jgi:type II secretory pathway pseudopilin PulG